MKRPKRLVAQPPTIRQAIERTEREVADPMGTCGFAPLSSTQVNRMLGPGAGRKSMAKLFRESAQYRLRVLKALLEQPRREAA